MCVDAASVRTSTPASLMAATSLPLALAWSSSEMTRTFTPRLCAATTASAISLHVMVKTHTSKVFVAALMTSRSRVSEVRPCAYSHASPRRHSPPRITARQGIFPSGKKSTSGAPAPATA